MKIQFTVPGEPQGKARHRTGNSNGVQIHYTPKNTKDYENLIKATYLSLFPRFSFPENIVLDLRVAAYYKIAKSTSKKKRSLMLSNALRPSKKPDGDNILKVVADALNTVAYKDDAQIADMQVRKFFSEEPRVEIFIQTVDEELDEIKMTAKITKITKS